MKRKRLHMLRIISMILVTVMIIQSMEGMGTIFAATEGEGEDSGNTTVSSSDQEEEKKTSKLTLSCEDFSSEFITIQLKTEEKEELTNCKLFRDSEAIGDFKDSTFKDTNVKPMEYSYQAVCYDSEGNETAKSNIVKVYPCDDWNITKETTLTKDTYVKNLNMVSSYKLNLNGYNLTVQKNINDTDGYLMINKGYLYCKGDYNCSKYGKLIMTDPNDYVRIDGNAYWNGYSEQELTNGVLELKGNFTEKAGGRYNEDNFTATGDHTTILSGENPQTVSFGTCYSHFSKLVLKNTSEQGIISDGALNALSIERNDTNLSLGIAGDTGYTLENDVEEQDDYTLLGGELDLNGHNLTVNGDLKVIGGIVNINGGTLTVKGNLIFEDIRQQDGETVVKKSFGKLVMKKPEDRVFITGDYIVGSAQSQEGSITNGIIEVQGDVRQVSLINVANFCMTGKSTLKLSGTKVQRIQFDASASNGSRLNNLEITNRSEEGVIISKLVDISRTITDKGKKLHGTVLWEDSTFAADNYFNGNIFSNKDIAFHQSFTIAGNLRLENNKKLDINGYHITVGNNVNINGAELWLHGGSVHCKGDFSCEFHNDHGSYLTMDNDKDSLVVEGDFYAESRYYGWDRIPSAGTIELKGNFTQTAKYDKNNFVASKSNHVILSGDKKQVITFQSAESTFATVDVKNTSADGVFAPNGLNAVTLNRNGCNVKIGTEESVYGWTLEKDQTWEGDLILGADTLNLNGHTLKVQGNLIQQGGAVTVNGGCLIVTGDYLIESKDEKGNAKQSTGNLVMTKKEDQVLVQGNFLMGSNNAHGDKLTNGVLKVAGDVTQVNHGNSRNFAATNNFTLELCGMKEQKVKFQNSGTDDSSIPNLVSTNASKEGVTLVNAISVTKLVNDNGNQVNGFVQLEPKAQLANESFSGSILINYYYTRRLSQNWNIRGELRLNRYAYLYLNGFNVMVGKNVVIDQGTMYLNNGRMTCKGNFICTPYSYSSSDVRMENSNDYLKVEGDFLLHCQSPWNQFKAGTLVLQGNFVQDSDYRYDHTFSATGSHVTIFEGTGKQTVTIKNSLVQFNKVIIKNKSEDGVYAENGIPCNELVVEDGAHYSTKQDGKIGWTLTEDETLEDLCLLGGTLDLDGHTLTIEHDLMQAGGTLHVHGGRLIVKGDYRLQSGTKDAYTPSSGRLQMQGKSDYVEVNGNVVINTYANHNGILTNGTFNLKGDLTQFACGVSGFFATSDSFVLKMSGTDKQTISFAESGLEKSKIANLKIENPEGITIKNRLAVQKTLDDGGYPITGEVIMLPGMHLENKHFTGDMSIENSQNISEDLDIDGRWTVSRCDINLYGHKITVGKTVKLYDTNVTFQKGSLICKENLILDQSYYYSDYSTKLNMEYDSDYILVEGNIYNKCEYCEKAKAGKIELKGNYIQESNRNCFTADGSFRLVMCGDKKQEIRIPNTKTQLNILEINNSSKEGVWVASNYINAKQVIETKGKLHVENNGVLGWQLKSDEVIEDNVYLVGGTLDLNGHNLTIDGNLYISSGTLKINGGKLNVSKSLRFQSIDRIDTKTNITYFGNSSGCLDMTNSDDYISVGGVFVMRSNQDSRGMLSHGTLEVRGDFYEYEADSQYYNFAPSGDHKVILSGSKKQTVYFESHGYSSCYFNDFMITNTSGEGILQLSDVYVKKNISDKNQKMIPSYNTYIRSLSQLSDNTYGGNIILTKNDWMKKNIIIGGCINFRENFYLKGFSLNAGELNLDSYAKVYMNGGKISVDRNFNIFSGYLYMNDDEDYITVAGNFYCNASGSEDTYLTAGTLEIKGDFTQNGSYSNFIASGTHKTILSGKTGTSGRKYIQVIRFGKIGTCKFHNLVLTKPKEYYSFCTDVEKLCNHLEYNIGDEEVPTKVTGLTILKKETTKLTLSWESSTDNEGVIGYEVYRGNKKVATTTKTSYTDTGLLPVTSYQYKVYAFDAARNLSEASDTISATTSEDTEAPEAPAALKVRTRTGSSITLAWNPAIDNVKVEQYKIYRDGKKIGTTNQITEYKDSENLDQDHLYTYEVTATDAAGNESKRSNDIKASVKMPEIIRISPEDNSEIGGDSQTLQVTFTNVGNSVGNKVQFEYWNEEHWEKINPVLIGQDSDYGTQLQATYHWDITKIPNGECKVRCTLYDNDKNTDTKQFTYYIDTQGPEAPTEVTAEPENGVVYLKWQASNSYNCEKYIIYRRKNEEEPFTVLTVVKGGDSEEWKDSNVQKNETYEYCIAGVDTFGQVGSQSKIVSCTVNEDTLPPSISDIVTEAERINKVSQIKVLATDNVGVTYMSLEYRNAAGEWITIGETDQILAGQGVFEWDTTKVADGEYTLHAFAKDGSGNDSRHHSICGEEIDFPEYFTYVTVDNTGVDKIQIASVKGYANYVELKWKEIQNDDFAYFAVEQEEDGGFKQVATTDTTLGAYISNLQMNTQYVFRVVGYDDLGNRGEPSDPVTVVTTEDTSAPIVKAFYPAEKYFNQSIPISIRATDDIGIASFRLEYSLDNENWNALTEEKRTGTETSCTWNYNFDVTDIPSGKVYMRVYVTDTLGNISNTNGEPITNEFFVDKEAPDIVKNFTAEGDNGSIILTWDKPKDELVSRFVIYRADEETGNYLELDNEVKTLKYIDKTASKDMVYSYKIAAVDLAGNVGECSKECVAQAGEDNEAPEIYGVSPKQDSFLSGTVNIEAAVMDNVEVDQVTFEYKKKDDTEEIWTELGNVSLKKSSGYPSVSWDVSGLADGAYEVRVYANDASGNLSDTKVYNYTIDNTLPEMGAVTPVAEGYAVKLSWNPCTDDDFSYYEVYGKLASEEEFTLLTNTTETSYEHTGLKAGRSYLYQVVAYDKAGNRRESEPVGAVPTDEDTEKPAISVSETMSVRMGSELKLDARASRDNVKIVDYQWDYGDGTTGTGAVTKHTYAELGKYQGTLTVTDAAGNQSEQSFTVLVRSRISAHVGITVRYSEGACRTYLPYSYLYIEKDGYGYQYQTDETGLLDVVLAAGTYNVQVYKQGYMPLKTTLTVSNGQEFLYPIELKKGSLVTGKLTSKRLTLEQLQDLHIDLQDENNWYSCTYTFDFSGTSSNGSSHSVELKKEQLTPIPSEWFNDTSSGSCYYGTYVDCGGQRVVLIYHTYTYLKKMYEIDLEVTNHAEAGSDFSIEESEATLKLPSGLSLLKTGEGQSLTNALGTLKPQQTLSTSWYVKADQPGSYQLKAAFRGKVMPFNAPFETEIVGEKPLVTELEEDNTFTDAGFTTKAAEDYFVHVINQRNEKVKGAIITLRNGGKKSQTITNGYGTGRLDVNAGDKRRFHISVSCEGYQDYVDSDYRIDTKKYSDTIVLLRNGEEKLETKEPLKIENVTMDGRDIRKDKSAINTAADENHTFRIQANKPVERYQLMMGKEVLKEGTADANEVSVTVNGKKLEKDASLKMIVYSGEEKAAIDLNVTIFQSELLEVNMRYQKYSFDLLTEATSVSLEDEKEKISITCEFAGDEKDCDRYELVLKDNVIAKSKDGKFQIPINNLKPGASYYLVGIKGKDVKLRKELLLRVTPKLGIDSIPLPVEKFLIPILGNTGLTVHNEEINDQPLITDFKVEFSDENLELTFGEKFVFEVGPTGISLRAESTTGSEDSDSETDSKSDISVYFEIAGKFKIPFNENTDAKDSYINCYDFENVEVTLSHLEIGISGSTKVQLLKTVPLFISDKMSGSFGIGFTRVTVDLNKNHSGKEKEEIPFEMKFELELGLSIGLEKVISAGLYGSINIEQEGILFPHLTMNDCNVKGSVYVKFVFLDRVETKIKIPKLQFDSDDFKRLDKDNQSGGGGGGSFYCLAFDENAYEPDDTEVTEKSDWFGNVPITEENSIQQLKTNASANLIPKLITCGDTTLMVYCDKIDGRNQLEYSCYNKEQQTWSSPQAVSDTEAEDFYPDLFTDGENIYITWSQSKTPLSEDDSLVEESKKMELVAAKYDVASGTFSSLGTVTDNETYESNIQSGTVDGKPVVTWFENSNGNVFGIEGTNTLWKAIYEDGAWQKQQVAEENGYITSVDCGILNGKTYLAFTEDMDQDLSTLSDQRLHLLGLSDELLEMKQFPDSDAQNVSFQKWDGQDVLTWYEAGTIHVLDSEDGSAQELTTKGQLPLGNYELVTDENGNASVIYTTTCDSKAQAYLIAYDKDRKEWGKKVALTDQDKYITDLHGAYQSNSLLLGFNQKDVTIEENDEDLSVTEVSNLDWMKVSSTPKFSITDVMYEHNEAIPGGDIALHVAVKNEGTGTADTYQVNVVNKKGETVASSESENYILPGTNGECLVSLKLPYSLEKTQYQVHVISNETEQDSYDLTLGYADLGVTHRTKVNSDGTYTVRAFIENKGIEATSGQVVFYDYYDEDKVLYMEQFQPINYGETTEIDYLPEKALYENKMCRNIGIKIIADAEEKVLEDNRTIAAIIRFDDSAAPCRVVFENEDGTELKAAYTDENAHVAFPDMPEKSGYTFEGWYSGKTKVTETTVITKDMMLTPKWIVKGASQETPGSQGQEGSNSVPDANTNDLDKGNSTNASPDNAHDKQTFQKGRVFTVNNAIYKITDYRKQSKKVTFIGLADKKLTKHTLPSVVNYRGNGFKVTTINRNAYRNCKRLKEVAIGSNVKVIGRYAFSGCTKLQKITIKSSGLSTVGKSILPKASKKIVIYVPNKKLKAYRILLKDQVSVKQIVKMR